MTFLDTATSIFTDLLCGRTERADRTLASLNCREICELDSVCLDIHNLIDQRLDLQERLVDQFFGLLQQKQAVEEEAQKRKVIIERAIRTLAELTHDQSTRNVESIH